MFLMNKPLIEERNMIFFFYFTSCYGRPGVIWQYSTLYRVVVIVVVTAIIAAGDVEEMIC